MEFDKLKTEIKTTELDMTRTDSEDYFEAVVKKVRLDWIIRILESFFGQSTWPSRTRVSKEVEAVINNFGGLRKGQTLYFLNDEAHSVFAMLWPWQDGERITIKIARV